MVNMERNETDFIQQTVRNMIQNSRVGEVVQVYEHVEDDDNSNFEADVRILGEDTEHRVAPIAGPHNDSIAVPKVGDKVVVEYLHGDKKNPMIRSIVNTNKDRPPKGEAGMWRQRVESGSTPAGDGDLYVTSHTRYNENPGLEDYRDLDPEQAFVRIAKKDDAMDDDSLPMTVEMFDDALNGDSWIKFEANKAGGTDSSVPYGFKINLNDGSFKVLDKAGYGIESDGNGNFTWHHESIDFSEGTTTSL